MDDQQQPLVINAQYVKDFSFENPNAPHIFSAMQDNPPQLGVDIAVEVTALNDQSFEVSIHFQAETKIDDKALFVMELDYAGVATLGEGLDEDLREMLLFVETPRYLFPAARHILSDLSREGGFPPLVLNPVDFHQLYLRRKQQDSAEQEKSAQSLH